MISKYFAPQNAVAAVRPTKLAKYLTLSGEWEVYVVCDTPDDVGLEDSLLARDASLLAGVKYIEPSLALRAYRALSGALLKLVSPSASEPEYRRSSYPDKPISSERGLAALKRTLMSRHFILGQRLLAKSAVATAEKYYADVSFDAVFTSHGPIMCDFAGLEAARGWPRARWVADFRDFVYSPVSHPRSYRDFIIKLVGEVVERADVVTSATAEITATPEFPASDKYRELTHGYDRGDLEGIKPETFEGGRLTLVNTGTVYPGYFETLFSIIDECARADDVNKNDFRIVYAGRHSAQFKELAARRGYAEIVEDRGLVAREKALALQLGADYIVMTAHTDNIGGGKSFERMMCARPMLAITRRAEYGGPLEKLARERGMGIYQWLPDDGGEPDCAAAARELCEAVRLKRAGEPIPYEPDKRVIDAYSYEKIARRLSELLGGEKTV